MVVGTAPTISQLVVLRSCKAGQGRGGLMAAAVVAGQGWPGLALSPPYTLSHLTQPPHTTTPPTPNSDEKVDNNHRAYFTARMANEWLSMRLDTIGACVVLVSPMWL